MVWRSSLIMPLLVSVVNSQSSQNGNQPQTQKQGFDLLAALHYLPSRVIGVVGLTIYFAISALIFWRLARNRDWWGLCLPIGCLCEGLGFSIRIFMGQPRFSHSLGVYVGMQSLIVLSPAAFLAFNYITYGRLIRLCIGREHSWMRPEIVGRVFVISDVFTFIVQAAGGSMEVQASLAAAGRVIFLVGIIAQGTSYVLYDFLVIGAHRSILKHAKRTNRDFDADSVRDPRMAPWYKIFSLLYFSSFFIIIRSIYRVAETAQGEGGYLLTHEWCFFVFDSIPLAIATSIYIFSWPGNFMLKEGSIANTQAIDWQPGGLHSTLNSSTPAVYSSMPEIEIGMKPMMNQ
ncbi:RTA1-domain-containing protein [Ramaria rubella]|nr:RTA1-domain-containing protein [Ramaria rubella]